MSDLTLEQSLALLGFLFGFPAGMLVALWLGRKQ
jgi:hypothetical protein